MGKVFKAIATVFGFFGLATFSLYVVMSANVSPLPSSDVSTPDTARQNLTADISANEPVSQALPTQAAALTQAPVENTAPASETTPSDATPSITNSPSVAPTPAPEPEPAPTPSPDAISIPPTASATVTVAPVAPTPPASTPQAKPVPPVLSSDSGIALPYTESNFAGDGNWQATWGTMSVSAGGYLELLAGPQSYGGAVYLKNPGIWANYAMRATVDLDGGSTFGLVADYKDASNYIVCQYTKTGSSTISAQLIQYMNGYELDLTPMIEAAWAGEGADINASIVVTGLYGSCGLNGETVSNQGAGAGKTAMSTAESGSIGFTINDATPGAAGITVKQVEVSGE